MVNLRFRESCGSKLSGLHTFDNTTISLNQKRRKNQKGPLQVNETLILEVTFVNFTENLSVVKIETQRTLEISTPAKITVGTHFHAQHDTD